MRAAAGKGKKHTHSHTPAHKHTEMYMQIGGEKKQHLSHIEMWCIFNRPLIFFFFHSNARNMCEKMSLIIYLFHSDTLEKPTCDICICNAGASMCHDHLWLSSLSLR